VLAAVAVAILVGIILATGASPIDAAARLWDSAFGNAMKISSTLKETTPLILAGLAVFVALKAGLFNIGVEGQITLGALCSAVVALLVPGAIGMVLAVLAGMLGGALWALPAGWIRAYRGGHEVISTIMLNNIASGLSLALVAGPLKDPTQEGTTTAELAGSSMFPSLVIGQLTISWSLPLSLVALALFAVWLRRSVPGFELRMVGDNSRAAEFAGVDVKRTILRAMLGSGALAGLTGAIQVLAFEHRFFQGISSGYGFDALGVALLSGSNPIGIMFSGLLFGTLNKGSSAIQLLGIPKGITYVVLGLLVIVFAAIRYRRASAQ
jgi:simple sugar transport system permease protein